jgi:formylglycine-generating enzyme required for sulfatase activity
MHQGSIALFCFLSAVVLWIVSVVTRQIVVASRAEAAASTPRLDNGNAALWNVLDFVVSLIILSSASFVLAGRLNWLIAVLTCVAMFVCYLSAYGPRRLVECCRALGYWLDQHESARMVNGDLPLGEVTRGYGGRLLHSVSWWPWIQQQHHGVGVVPVGLVLFGLGVMLTFGVMTLLDGPTDWGDAVARPARSPALLSIPSNSVRTAEQEVSAKALERIEIDDRTVQEGKAHPMARPPVLDQIDDRTVDEGESIVVPIMIESPGQPFAAIQYSLSDDSPEDATIDPASGVFSWTPTRAGTYAIGVCCESLAPGRMRDEATFSIVVREVRRAPQRVESTSTALELEPIDDHIADVGTTSPVKPDLSNTTVSVGDSSMPDIVGDSSMPEIVGDTRMPDIVGDSSVPDMVGDSSVPEIAGDTSVPEIVGDTSMPEIVGDTSMPEIVGDTSMPDIVGDTSMPKMDGDTSVPKIDDEASIPEIVDDPSEPKIISDSSVPSEIGEPDTFEEPRRPANDHDPTEHGERPDLARPNTEAHSADATEFSPNHLPDIEAERSPLGSPPLLEPEPAQPEIAAINEPIAAPDMIFVNSIGMELVPVRQGTFLMGSRESAQDLAPLDDLQAARFRDEQPQHPVLISRPFAMGRFEVTIDQFRRFVNEAGYRTDAERDGQGGFAFHADSHEFRWGKQFNWQNTGWIQTRDHPVVNVSWNDATAFCRWLSETEGRLYRLPTEAEWEYACRAGTETHYSSGDSVEQLAAAANLGDESFRRFIRPDYSDVVPAAGQEGPAFTTPVGCFQPNSFGLHDMHGNVFEWCADRYSTEYYQQSPLVDPKGPSSGTKHVIRGGSYFNSPFYSRSSFRNGFPPQARVPYLGFRVVMEMEPEQQPEPVTR